MTVKRTMMTGSRPYIGHEIGQGKDDDDSKENDVDLQQYVFYVREIVMGNNDDDNEEKGDDWPQSVY